MSSFSPDMPIIIEKSITKVEKANRNPSKIKAKVCKNEKIVNNITEVCRRRQAISSGILVIVLLLITKKEYAFRHSYEQKINK